jgi:hypothetical protein
MTNDMNMGPMICIRPEGDRQGTEAIVEILGGEIVLTIARRANGRDVFSSIPASPQYARLLGAEIKPEYHAAALVRTADQHDRMSGVGSLLDCEGEGKGGLG